MTIRHRTTDTDLDATTSLFISQIDRTTRPKAHMQRAAPPNMTTTTTTLSPTKALAALSLDDGARPPETTANDDELERFRREWRQEVQGRKAGTAKPADDAPAVAVAVPATAVPADKPSRASLDRVRSRESAGSHKSPKQAPALGSSPTKLTLPTPRSPTKAAYAGIGLYAHHTVPAGPSRHVHTLGGTTASAKIPFRAPQVTKDKDAAVEVYARAVEREQSGQLNEALKLYRQAFKLDDNVDRLYARVAARQAAEVQEAAAAEVEEQLTSADVVDPSAPEEEPYDFTRHIQTAPDYEKAAKARLAGASRLSALFSALDEAHDTFLPEDEELPIPIAKLPAELLEPIFAHLDVATIERFALTCWRARALTAVAGKWKRLAEGIYRSPSMVPPGLAPRELARRHRGEWRTALVEEERIRMDGCYISVCHYIRPGAGEQWVAITHMSECEGRASIRGAYGQS